MAQAKPIDAPRKPKYRKGVASAVAKSSWGTDATRSAARDSVAVIRVAGGQGRQGKRSVSDGVWCVRSNRV